jgi:hypothetical protein
MLSSETPVGLRECHRAGRDAPRPCHPVRRQPRDQRHLRVRPPHLRSPRQPPGSSAEPVVRQSVANPPEFGAAVRHPATKLRERTAPGTRRPRRGAPRWRATRGHNRPRSLSLRHADRCERRAPASFAFHSAVARQDQTQANQARQQQRLAAPGSCFVEVPAKNKKMWGTLPHISLATWQDASVVNLDGARWAVKPNHGYLIALQSLPRVGDRRRQPDASRTCRCCTACNSRWMRCAGRPPDVRDRQ